MSGLPQNTSQKDPCDTSDLVTPPGVSLNKNIAESMRQADEAIKPHWYDGPDSGNDPLARMAGLALWFYNQVDYGKDWDYKRIDPKYQAFGDFNFGATGAATTLFTENTIQRMAGWAQQRHPEQGPGDGGRPGSLMHIVIDNFLGRKGGQAPYGDYKWEQDLILRGIAYYKAGCYKKQ